MSETEIGARRSALLMRLRDEKDAGVRGGVYHRLQVEMRACQFFCVWGLEVGVIRSG